MLAFFVLTYSLRHCTGIDQLRITQETLDRFSVALATRRPWAEDEIDSVRLSIVRDETANLKDGAIDGG